MQSLSLSFFLVKFHFSESNLLSWTYSTHENIGQHHIPIDFLALAHSLQLEQDLNVKKS